MAKALYLCKIAMTAHQLPNLLTAEETQHCKRMATFIAVLYAKYWLQAPLAAAAPRLDLQFWKDVKLFEVCLFDIFSIFLYSLS